MAVIRHDPYNDPDAIEQPPTIVAPPAPPAPPAGRIAHRQIVDPAQQPRRSVPLSDANSQMAATAGAATAGAATAIGANKAMKGRAANKATRAALQKRIGIAPSPNPGLKQALMADPTDKYLKGIGQKSGRMSRVANAAKTSAQAFKAAPMASKVGMIAKYGAKGVPGFFGLHEIGKGINQMQEGEYMGGLGRMALGGAALGATFLPGVGWIKLGAQAAPMLLSAYDYFAPNEAQAASPNSQQPAQIPASQAQAQPVAQPVAQAPNGATVRAQSRRPAQPEPQYPRSSDRDNEIARLRYLAYQDSQGGERQGPISQQAQRGQPVEGSNLLVRPDGTYEYAVQPQGIPQSFQPIHALVGNESYIEEFNPGSGTNPILTGSYSRGDNPVAFIPGTSEQSRIKLGMDLAQELGGSSSSSETVDPESGVVTNRSSNSVVNPGGTAGNNMINSAVTAKQGRIIARQNELQALRNAQDKALDRQALLQGKSIDAGARKASAQTRADATRDAADINSRNQAPKTRQIKVPGQLPGTETTLTQQWNSSTGQWEGVDARDYDRLRTAFRQAGHEGAISKSELDRVYDLFDGDVEAIEAHLKARAK